MTAQPAPKPQGDLLDRLDGVVARIEGACVVVIVAAMVGLSALQLVLRATADFGFEWADLVVRQMVLWLGFMGGALATQRRRHIAIDAVTRALAPHRAALVEALTSSAATVVVAVMARAAGVYVLEERSAGTPFYGPVPLWPFLSVLPLALGLIVFHLLVATRNAVAVALGRRPPPPREAPT